MHMILFHVRLLTYFQRKYTTRRVRNRSKAFFVKEAIKMQLDIDKKSFEVSRNSPPNQAIWTS